MSAPFVVGTPDEVFAGSADCAVVCGDWPDVGSDWPEDSAQLVYCDSPYGLRDETGEDAAECLRAWISAGAFAPKATGYMGQTWDGIVPGPAAWAQVRRIVVPGSYVVSYSSSRTSDVLSIAMRLAGLRKRSDWAWLQGQGMPRHADVGAAIEAHLRTGKSRTTDRRKLAMGDGYVPSGRGRKNYDHGCGSVMDSAPRVVSTGAFAGYGTQLKPAFEPIVVLQRPLDGSVAANALKHGTGAFNVSDARIDRGNGERTFPTSIAVVHDESCKETRKGWRCSATCPAPLLSARPRAASDPSKIEAGDAARYFYNAKATKAERLYYLSCSPNRCLFHGGVAYHHELATNTARGEGGVTLCSLCLKPRTAYEHPTVKPLALADYHAAILSLPRLPDGRKPLALVPYCGSGPEVMALLDRGFRVIGVDNDPRHAAMTRYRASKPRPGAPAGWQQLDMGMAT
jgi:site-specific DNA-methyltransferase (adenine-specific)